MLPRIIVLLSISLAALVAAFSYPYIPSPSERSVTEEAQVAEKDTAEPQAEPSVEVSVTAKDDIYSFVAPASGTVEELMNENQVNGSVSFTAKTYPSMGLLVTSINGRQNANGSYWMLYINDQFSSVGMSQAVVTQGDVIEWRYE